VEPLAGVENLRPHCVLPPSLEGEGWEWGQLKVLPFNALQGFAFYPPPTGQ